MTTDDKTSKPLCIDLCCGTGGWTDAFLQVGYNVIGFDTTRYPEYNGQLIIQDIRTLDGKSYRGLVDVIVASPPCSDFSRHDQPWTKARHPPEPDMSIVNTCLRLKNEINPRIFILENVRGAQKWLGKAILRRGPFFLWGDVVLVPTLTKYRQKQSLPSSQAALRARIPHELAYPIALLCKQSHRKTPSLATQKPTGH